MKGGSETSGEPLQFSFPWKLGNKCPCGSGMVFEFCCRMPNGQPLIRTPTILPVGPMTGFQNRKCYLRNTNNCSEKISGEHLISASILKQLPGGIKMSGFPGQEIGAFKQVGINSLKSNVLCSRHNSALSPLDTAAGHFFANITAAMKHSEMHSMIKKTEYFLVNGDAFERWAVKTAMGLYHSKVASANGEALYKSHTLNESHAIGLLADSTLPPPEGMWITLEQTNQFSEQINIAPLIHLASRTLCGLTIQLPGITFGVVIDASRGNNNFFIGTSVYRPSLLIVEGRKRSSHVFLTWPGQGIGGHLVKFKATPRPSHK